jgi:hypothetical protein
LAVPLSGVNLLFRPTTDAAVECAHSVERQRSNWNGVGPPFQFYPEHTKTIATSHGASPPSGQNGFGAPPPVGTDCTQSDACDRVAL